MLQAEECYSFLLLALPNDAAHKLGGGGCWQIKALTPGLAQASQKLQERDALVLFNKSFLNPKVK